MATTDLCTVDDVRRYAKITTTVTDKKITQFIPDASTIVIAESEDETLTSSNIFAKMACSYLVAVMLEGEQGVKDGSRKMRSFSDGDFSATFADSSEDQVIPGTNSGRYEYYLNKIRANPFAYELSEDGSYYYICDDRYYRV